MAHLSRIWLNPWRRQTRRFIRDPQALHAAVLGGLPDQPVTQRILWRLDGGNERVIPHVSDDPSSGATSPAHRLALYVVTQSMPSWEHLTEQAGWPSANSETAQAEIRDYEPLLKRLRPGDHFAFRLTANPTKSVRPASASGSKPSRGKRVAHVTARQQLDWLISKANGLGFEIPPPTSPVTASDGELDVRISDRQLRSFTKGRNQSRRVTVATATFDGHLVIRDADKLRTALVDGIGPAKAYGCGLLTLAPLRR